MMSPLFVIDTDAFLDAWRYWYGPDNFPDLWDCLVEMAEEGSVRIPREVAREVTETPGEASDWMKMHRAALAGPTSARIQRLAGLLTERYPNFGNTNPGGKNWADPFVVANAIVLADEAPKGQNVFVVTNESMARKSAPPKIPNVCDKEGLRIRKLHQVIKAGGWTFKRNGRAS